MTPLLRLRRSRRQPSFGQINPSKRPLVRSAYRTDVKENVASSTVPRGRQVSSMVTPRPLPSATDGFGVVITRQPRGPFTFIVGRILEMRPLGPCLHDHRDEAEAQARRSELQRPSRSRSNFDDEDREHCGYLVQSRPSTRRLQRALPCPAGPGAAIPLKRTNAVMLTATAPTTANIALPDR